MDKPADWTSNDVVIKLKRVLREKRIGHGGTLDPMATGILPIFVGRATRAVEFAVEGRKEYIARLTLGMTTDTQDATGTILTETACRVSRAELETVLPDFLGELQQVPPMYSALKVGGKRLYDLARKGQVVEREPRPITIHALEVLEQEGENCFLLRVECSKGTYIRTLCHDIGAQLGVGGVMSALRRTRVAEFTLAQSVTLEALIASEEPEQFLLPVDTCFAQYPARTIGGRAERLCRNGNAFPTDAAPGLWRVYAEDGTFLMLGESAEGSMRTVKSFFEV